MTKPTTQPVKQIKLGETKTGDPVIFDLFKFLETRLLIQASSGGGKSYQVRRIIEQVLHQNIPVWVVDPEGEFTTLREKFDVVIFAVEDGDLNLKPETLEAALPELLKKGVSCVFDLSDLNLEEKRERVVQICHAILSLPKADWKSLLLCVDEAQIFAPEGKSSASIDAITDLASRIRKRGVGLVVATQRLSALDKNLTSHLHNRILGYCLEDIEVKRAAGYIGAPNSKLLVGFQPGDFFALGAALNFRAPVQFRAGSVETTHPDPSTRRSIVAPKATTQLEQVLKELRESIEIHQEKERTEKSIPVKAANFAHPDIPDSIIEREKALNQRERNLNEYEQKLRKLDHELFVKLQGIFGETQKLMEEKFAVVNNLLQSIFVFPGGSNIVAENKTIPNEKFETVKTAPGNGVKPVPAAAAKTIPPAKREQATTGGLSLPQQKILDALALCERLGLNEPKRINVAFFAGYTENGHFNNIVGMLNTMELLHYPSGGRLALTNGGRALANAGNNPIQNLEEMHDFWLSKLDRPKQRVLHVLLEKYPNALPREELARLSGYTVNGHFNNTVGSLATLGVADYPRKGYVAATEVMFPEGLK